MASGKMVIRRDNATVSADAAAGPRTNNEPDNRTRLILAAVDIVEREGPAAVTAGRLAATLGLSRQLVHYYFGTIEELLIALMRYAFAETKEALETALASDDPIGVVRRVYSVAIPAGNEFMAMSLRNEAIGKVYRELTLEIRALYSQTLKKLAESNGFVLGIEPSALIFLLQTISQGMGVEAALGISAGHAGADRAVAWLIDQALGHHPQVGEVDDSSKSVVSPHRLDSESFLSLRQD